MSKWVEVHIHCSNYIECRIRVVLRRLFATCFVSIQMKVLWVINSVKYNTISPCHPSSNDQPERSVPHAK